jgi:ATP-dependent helicase HrpA
VPIVAGETGGSGKTTQIPKICLELGRGPSRGQRKIGHTQPRRLAAQARVAERIAEELGTPARRGTPVGYKVRFTDQVGDDTLVKLMTDGILLAELQRDRTAAAVRHADHRRGARAQPQHRLHPRLPQAAAAARPDLKVIITSATIDPERFAEHFTDRDGNRAPIVEVSGRTYPGRGPLPAAGRRPDDPDGDPDRDQIQAISDAVDELSAEGPGDILVFLSGEREIRDTADALNKLGLRRTEVMPLYARLSTAEQHRSSSRTAAPRRAGHQRGRDLADRAPASSTSSTRAPRASPATATGPRCSGCRSSRSRRPRPTSARAAAGAPRTASASGSTRRKTSSSRPEFTEPEILRTNLASVILQMTNIGLGDIGGFPFVEPPDRRNIKDGLDLLHELGAIDR